MSLMSELSKVFCENTQRKVVILLNLILTDSRIFISPLFFSLCIVIVEKTIDTDPYLVKIEPTRITPYFKLDLASGIMDFKGRSSPCASREFYYPIIERIENAFREGTNTLTANFAFEYFNTSSSKCLFDILRKLARYKTEGANVVVNWYYDEFDDDMKETGEDYEDILGMDFNYIPI